MADFKGRRTQTLEEAKNKLLAYVKKVDSGCWLFIGARNKKGYGYCRVLDNKGKIKLGLAHRVFYLSYKNLTLEDKRLVLHKCRNKNCINPEHLYLGTHENNIRDAIKDGTAHSIKERDNLGRFK